MAKTKISLAMVRALLPVGKVFTATFIGRLNSRHDPEPRRRRVVKQTPVLMVSTILEGPKAEEDIYGHWNNVRATIDANEIITLWMTETKPHEPFLRLEIP